MIYSMVDKININLIKKPFNAISLPELEIDFSESYDVIK